MRFDDPDHAHAMASPYWSDCERQIVAFERAWQARKAPAIADYLQVHDQTRFALLIELIHVDLEFRFKEEQAVDVESYFRAFPELWSNRRFALAVIAAEIELLRKNGVHVSTNAYVNRYPSLSADLHVMLEETPIETARPTIPWGISTIDPGQLPEIPGYEIVGPIGLGGMGLVFKAIETDLGRSVAIKVLPFEYAHDPERLGRFLHEARTASSLNHPNICTIHALGEHLHRPYIVMELIEGETLRALLSKKPSWTETCRILRQAARALAAAHHAGVVHRDIKPENIMVRADGYAKVLDFGLARQLPRFGAAKPGWDTDPGAFIGTVCYMSPEQAGGLVAEASSDIFALGIVLYQLVTGLHPFERPTNLATLSAITHDEPLPPSTLDPSLPAILDGLLSAMLHKNPRLRPTAAEVGEFLSNLLATPTSHATVTSPTNTTGRTVLPRHAELAKLRDALDRAAAAKGLLVCVAGEPGIGKTTLVEGFLESMDRGGVLIGRGNCFERRADTEAYLPALDALTDLLRKDVAGSISRLMQVVAPTWHAQLTRNAESGSAGQDERRALSQQAMLREFRTLVHEITRLGTLVLFFEDVHWADAPTVDLITHLRPYLRELRLLIIATFRPTEMLLGPHPFHMVRQEFVVKGDCIELALGFLSRADCDQYIDLAFPHHKFPADFGDLIYARTEGSPLFMVDLLRYLRERDVLAEVDGIWRLTREVPDFRQDLPGSVRNVLQRKLHRLTPSERRFLEVASVQGTKFDSASIAEVLGQDLMEVEDRIQGLHQLHGLIQPIREQEFPDGTITLQCKFVHTLYQQALEAELLPARRVNWSLALARALERRACGLAEPAAELACLYEAGRDFQSAARQFRVAAENAARVFAHREAIGLAQRGLSLLQRLPENAERARYELPLLTILGLQLQVTRGFADPQAKEVYTRGRELCAQHSEASGSFPVLWGLWLYSKVRSELSRAQERAEELALLASDRNDPNWMLQANQALGITALCRGIPKAAVEYADHANDLYDAKRHRMHAFLFGQDPGVICSAFGAVALWILGYPEQARERSRYALEMSRGLSPSCQTVALHFAAMLHQLQGDFQGTLAHAQASVHVAAEHGLSFWQAGGAIFEGWAIGRMGDEVGLARLQTGLRDWLATQSLTYHTYHLGLLADLFYQRKRYTEALRIVDESLLLAHQTGERMVEPELYRMRGEILLQAKTDGEKNAILAVQSFKEAYRHAQEQNAKAFELKAALSLARVERSHGITADALACLRSTVQSLPSETETVLLREAHVFLK